MKKFWKLLNKTEIKHLHQYGIRSLASFKDLREGQLKREAQARGKGYIGSMAMSCYECRDIAKKVGLK